MGQSNLVLESSLYPVDIVDVPTLFASAVDAAGSDMLSVFCVCLLLYRFEVSPRRRLIQSISVS